MCRTIIVLKMQPQSNCRHVYVYQNKRTLMNRMVACRKRQMKAMPIRT